MRYISTCYLDVKGHRKLIKYLEKEGIEFIISREMKELMKFMQNVEDKEPLDQPNKYFPFEKSKIPPGRNPDDYTQKLSSDVLVASLPYGGIPYWTIFDILDKNFIDHELFYGTYELLDFMKVKAKKVTNAPRCSNNMPSDSVFRNPIVAKILAEDEDSEDEDEDSDEWSSEIEDYDDDESEKKGNGGGKTSDSNDGNPNSISEEDLLNNDVPDTHGGNGVSQSAAASPVNDDKSVDEDEDSEDEDEDSDEWSSEIEDYDDDESEKKGNGGGKTSDSNDGNPNSISEEDLLNNDVPDTHGGNGVSQSAAASPVNDDKSVDEDSNSTLPPTVPTNESYADTSADVQGKETTPAQAEEGLINDDVPDTHDRISKSAAASPGNEEVQRNAEGVNEEPKKNPVQVDDFEQDKSEKKQVVRKKNKKQHECFVCGRMLSKSSALTVHMRKHTGEKPFECDICQMRFADSSRLRRHKKSHTGEKLFRCDVCEKKFARSDNLLYHRRSHTGVRAHECDVCGRRFGKRCNLLAHKRIHIKGKPYACDVCDFKCANMGNLKMHKRIHTKDWANEQK